MLNKIIPTIIILITFSCGKEISSRHYKSLDKFMGGFNDLCLDLESNGDLKLFYKTYGIKISENEWGDPTAKTIHGEWYLSNGVIYYSFNESKTVIDSFFFADIFKDKQIITFSKNLDTAYIFGIPCILTECETENLSINNQYNDTSKVKFIQGIVFDTTATLVVGYVTDRITRNSIRNVSVTLQNDKIEYFTTTDSTGQFSFFKDLNAIQYSITLTHPKYKCLIVNNVVQTGGQWISFSMIKQ